MKTEIAKTSGRGELALAQNRPSFISVPEEGLAKGLQEMSRVLRPSFVKLVQAMSSPEMKKQHGEGSLVLVPDGILLTRSVEDEGVGLKFAPILFYIEYCKWTGIAMRGIEPMIVERTMDSRHPVAVKSQSSATWSEPHPKDPDNPRARYRYCEHLNFIVKIMEPDLLDTPPIVVSFTKSSYQTGTTLARLCMRRKAPLFSGQYLLSSRLKTNDKGTFYILGVDDHPTEPWITDEDTYDLMAKMHDDFEGLMKARKVEVSYDDDDEANTGSY